jgi:hypothetical protein
MVITTRTPGNVHTVSIPWDNSILGPQAQTRMVRESGMEAGKEVQFKTFMPEFQKIASSTIKFGDMETLVLDGRPLALRRAAMTQDILPGLVTQAWLDEKGNVVRSYMDVLGGMETLRCTREQAMKAIRPDDAADVMGRFLVRSNETLSRPTEVTEAVYRIEAKADSLRRLQLEDRRQSVLERLADGIVLRVKALADADAPAAQQPGPEFLKSSPYLQRDDQDIVKAARKASGDAKTAQEKAFRLRAWVSKYVAQKDYDVAFASAKEVLLSREGDCTEHSVLLAALLRAEDIPSRVVVGVVYWKGNFAYHMWTEAFLNDWVAMDAMFAEDVADATHIKLADSALDTASASDPFLSVVEVVGKMKIGVQNAECRVQSAE